MPKVVKNMTELVEYVVHQLDEIVWLNIFYVTYPNITAARLARRRVPASIETRIIKRTIIEEVVE